MQIFVRILSGKTISIDVNKNTLLFDILNYVNEYDDKNQYQNLIITGEYYEEHPLVVEKNKILDLNQRLISLYKNKIIKEIVFLAI